jgi:transposase
MARGRPKAPLSLSEEERRVLESYARQRKIAHQLALRARIVLGCAGGEDNQTAGRRLGVHAVTVGKWRARFLRERLQGLSDAPRSGAPRSIDDAQVERVVKLTLEATPKNATHWSTRSMARRVGLSQTTIARIWRAFSLQPHRIETFRLSNDPQFVDKVRDIVGLYLNPPERAMVLCVDEKSQIQALDRTQPMLPLRPGQPERRTHDYRRHGTTSLFAALDVVSGSVLGKCYRRHRTREFLDFLKQIDSSVSVALDLHLILDNYSTHKTEQVRRWLARHPRFHLHFTPTYSSWINLVERFFALLSQQWLKRSAHRSTFELEQAILRYIEHGNRNPKPFVWTKSADQILETIARFCQRTLAVHAPDSLKRTSDTGH